METNDNKDIVKSTSRGFVWKLLEKVFGQVVMLVIQIILARLLSPDDYGAVGLLTIFITISDVFILQGFTTALIQKKNPDEVDYSSVFYANLMVSVVLYVILFFVAPLVGKYYNNAALVPFMRVLSLNVIIGAIPAVSNAILSRNLDFKKSFFRNAANSLTQGVVGITLALLGFGAWSMVICKIAGTFVGAIVLFITVRWLPKPVFSFKRIGKLFKYSSKVLGTGLLNAIFNNLNAILIGRYHSTAAVGYYQRGQSIPQVAMTSLDGAMSEVLYPSFSRQQDDIVMLKNSVRKTIQISMFVCCPILVGLLVIAKPLTIVLLTDKWLPSVPYMQLMCIICMFWPLSHRNDALNALGKSGITLLLSIFGQVLSIVVIVLFIKKSIILLLVGTIVASLISAIVASIPLRIYLKYRFREMLFDAFVPLLLAAVMGGFAYLPVLYNTSGGLYSLLLKQILIGVSIYVTLTLVFKPAGFSSLVKYVNVVFKGGAKNG